MSLRLYVPAALSAGLEFALPEEAARHVQVRRMQPGDGACLFDGRGGEWTCVILRMGRRDVDVRVLEHDPVERGLGIDLEIAFGMPANERMDALVEKATELGVAVIHPLLTARSVLRLDGERAARRVAHWQSVAEAASEQSGRTRVPRVAPVVRLEDWLGGADIAQAAKMVLTPGDGRSLADRLGEGAGQRRWIALSGPEGGLTAAEVASAMQAGFEAATLGPLVLRADTAPLAWLAAMALAESRCAAVPSPPGSQGGAR